MSPKEPGLVAEAVATDPFILSSTVTEVPLGDQLRGLSRGRVAEVRSDGPVLAPRQRAKRPRHDSFVPQFGTWDRVWVAGVCDANAGVSWSVRARLHREAVFHGPVQLGHSAGLAPMRIGSHYVVRTGAVRDIGGVGPNPPRTSPPSSS